MFFRLLSAALPILVASFPYENRRKHSKALLTTTTHVATTVDPSTVSVRHALLIAIITICATIVVVALCCGVLCLVRIRFRIITMRQKFYNRSKQRRESAVGASNDYEDHLPKKNNKSQLEIFKIEDQNVSAEILQVGERSKLENNDSCKDKWEIKLKHLVINEQEKLGSGAFASVFKGTIKGKSSVFANHAKLNVSLHFQENMNNEVAVKMLHKHTGHANRVDILNEIDFMKKLGFHPHVLNMIGCVTNVYNPLLVVEFCSKGDLLHLLRHQRTGQHEVEDNLCLKDLISFSWQVSDGMSYLSSRNFIHRDVAARNVLITSNNTAKIGDFGLCRYTTEALYTTRGGKLPIKWMAPESLKMFEFSLKSDIWSFAVLLYEIFTLGDAPYFSIQPTDMMKYLEDGNRLEKPEICPAEIYDLMSECWLVPQTHL
ncbi:hypothetical protein L596_021368 [Steinernema carpocapsae]|uniref:Protein kinase domain-containing protein n=1 Tax=Steinernema carpocapsae TaxID=34508 RepID=A0A4U5MIX0_STECR|nr:hypothetical protein L596_021368 [Steinernema carpocapsae]